MEDLSRKFNPNTLKYQIGLGNHFASECLEGALPQCQNTPQKCPYGLYAEQLSGTPFTYARAKNQRSWLYRILPTTSHEPYTSIPEKRFANWVTVFDQEDKRLHTTPQQFRWKPMEMPSADKKVTFIEGITTMCGAGGPSLKNGISMHLYACNENMGKQAFYTSDGDFLIVPQQGALLVKTEFGMMKVEPYEIVVIQRGIKFSIDLLEGQSKGYMCEVYKGHFILPDMGPIGSNGMANGRDFEVPVAWYEDTTEEWTITNKFMGEFFQYKISHSPFDVVAWHGNYAPYKYDLRKYNTIGSISFDHPDPSIFTVLTCQTDDPGQAVCDFAIFPPRWLVQEHTFKPPYYHRNTMTEFMGNIAGTYDAKEKGFPPGAASLHSAMTGHGPEKDVFEKASNVELKPEKVGENSMAFMFETAFMMKTTDYAMQEKHQDTEYFKCWEGLVKHFDKNMKLQ